MTRDGAAGSSATHRRVARSPVSRGSSAVGDHPVGPVDRPGAEPVEDGRTFEANARLKARYYARMTGLPTLADDSGIEVDALDGGPGVRTRRYAGEEATDAQNNAKLLASLAVTVVFGWWAFRPDRH